MILPRERLQPASNAMQRFICMSRRSESAVVDIDVKPRPGSTSAPRPVAEVFLAANRLAQQRPPRIGNFQRNLIVSILDAVDTDSTGFINAHAFDFERSGRSATTGPIPCRSAKINHEPASSVTGSTSAGARAISTACSCTSAGVDVQQARQSLATSTIATNCRSPARRSRHGPHPQTATSHPAGRA